MQDNDLRTIAHIDKVLSKYEGGEISLQELQTDLETYVSVLEGRECAALVESLENLDGDIELLLYAESERKRDKKAKKLIAGFHSSLRKLMA